MTYINLSRHDARLGGDLRLRLARYPQAVGIWIIQVYNTLHYIFTTNKTYQEALVPICGISNKLTS
jgi:hypothetical protein